MKTDPPAQPSESGGISRRWFFKGIGATGLLTAAATRVEAVAKEIAAADSEKRHGPGELPVVLRINGETHKLQLEPRTTLLEALREKTPLTGAKEVCDRATCGACTVLVGGMPVYACMKLAIDSQAAEITTIEGLSKSGELTALQKAFVEKDALMCGYCTPGFVMTLAAFLKENPKPTPEEVRAACTGNLCRCGTYPNVFKAALAAAQGGSDV